MKMSKIVRNYMFLAILSLFFFHAVAGCAQVASGDAGKAHWVGTWATSAQDVEADLMPTEYKQLTNTTLRQIVRVSVGGSKINVRFSNFFADWRDNLTIKEAYVAVSAGGSAIDPASSKQLTFSGKTAMSIPSGCQMVSDNLEFDLKPGSDLVITTYIEKAPRKTTGHRSARGEVVFFKSGNAATDEKFEGSVTNKCWYYLCAVDVLSSLPGASIVCLGDSITDGKGSTEGENKRWPDMLARRLQADPKYAGVGVLNQGIGGNCLWSGGIAQPVIQRMERDMLAQSSAKWVILLEGINDIGNNGRTTTEEVITAMKQVISRARSCGMKVYGSTILPCGYSFYDRGSTEEKRLAINEWIRTSGEFDAVIDWDAVVRDPQDNRKLLEAADSGDHLHLSDAGYQMMIDAVDLSLFQ